MKLSSLIMIFAAVADARNQAVGSRWERKLGYREQKVDKKDMKAEAKQFQAMQRSMIVKARPSGDRREARRNKIENRQNGRDDRRENRVENKIERNEAKSGSRAETRQEQLQQKKEERNDARSEKKAERTANKIEIINSRQVIQLLKAVFHFLCRRPELKMVRDLKLENDERLEKKKLIKNRYDVNFRIYCLAYNILHIKQ